MYAFWHLVLACTASGRFEIPADTEADTGDPPTEIEPDYSRWIGVRAVLYDGCEGRIEEEGERLESDWDHYELVESLCLACDGFYKVRVSPESVCGLSVTQNVYRALRFEGEFASVYNLILEENRWDIEALDEGGSFNGWDIHYDYTFQVWGPDAEIEGEVNFPMQ